jgi:hypothetical protein
MAVVPKRIRIAAALLLIIVVSLVMILSGSLDGAAAWANIIALPVAIVGLVVAGRPQDRHSPAVHQTGVAGRDQFNVAGDFTPTAGER